MTTEKDMLDALIAHQVFSYRASTKVVNELIAEFLASTKDFASLLRELLDEMTDAEREAFVMGKYTTNDLKALRTAINEWSSSLSVTLPGSFTVSAIAMATYEASFTSRLYGKEIELSGEKVFSQAKKTPVVGGQLYDDIWNKLASSTREKALYVVREGIQAGLTTKQIVDEIKGKHTKMADGSFKDVGGIVDQTKTQIESSVRTVRSHVANEAMVDVFEALGFDYLKVVATLDGRTCPICSVRDGEVHKASEFNDRPPWHYRTRTIVVGCDKDGKIDGLRPFVADTRSVKDIPKGERVGKIGQVDADTTYKEWFEKQDVSLQKEILGKTKFTLYEQGGFSLDKFVDPLNKPYTIKELREMDEKIFKELGL